MDNEKVSVIIPSFNYAHYVADAVKSVIAQSYANFECIVVDDGSTDDTKSKVMSIASIDKRIIYVHQENGGLSAARNTGLRIARGSFIQFLDADDLLQSKKLESQIAYLKRHPEIDIVLSKALHFESDDVEKTFESVNLFPRAVDAPDFLSELLIRNVMVVSAPLLRRAVTDTVGVFDIRLRALEDWEYWLRCAMNGFRFAYDEGDATATLIRFHPESMSRNKTLMLETMIKIREEFARLLPRKELVQLNSKELVYNRMSLGIEKIRRGRKKDGILELFRNFIRCGNIFKLAFGLRVLLTGK